jgi:HprK-related kinase B
VITGDTAAVLARAQTPHVLPLRVVDVPIVVQTNDLRVWTALRLYYEPWLAHDTPAEAAVVWLVHDGSITGPDGFRDVVRGAGRKVKEAVREGDGERLVLKRTTGVLMGVRPGHAWATGNLVANLNQAVNLVNHCYARAVLARGHLLLHASAVSWNGHAAALAGPPGAGKSTAALHLVEAGYRFVSNDRLLTRPLEDHVEALGYPKQPRVNPGTLLSHPRLRHRLSPEERRALEAMPPGELWDLERKSDVDLNAIYVKGTMELRGDLRALVLLRWTRDGVGLDARRLTLARALATVPLVHKDLGVFDIDRPFDAGPSAPDLAAYARLFARIAVIEVRGRVQPAALGDVVGPLVGR